MIQVSVLGSLNVAVPACTARVPANRNWMTSSVVSISPTPKIGIATSS